MDLSIFTHVSTLANRRVRNASSVCQEYSVLLSCDAMLLYQVYLPAWQAVSACLLFCLLFAYILCLRPPVGFVAVPGSITIIIIICILLKYQ